MKILLAGAALLLTLGIAAALHSPLVPFLTPKHKFKAGDCITLVMRIGPSVDEVGVAHGRPICTVVEGHYQIQDVKGRAYKINDQMVERDYIDSNYMQTECDD